MLQGRWCRADSAWGDRPSLPRARPVALSPPPPRPRAESFAFSACGPTFPSSTSTAGSIGPITSPVSLPEPNQLVSGDNCPTTLGYVAGACGRDPYYFGSNPNWANPSKQVACCKSFIMFLTDGEANLDTNIPAALQDYAHVAHGSHCAGDWTGPPASNPTAAQYL